MSKSAPQPAPLPVAAPQLIQRPPPSRRRRLNTAADILREQRRIYWEAREGRLDVVDAVKFGYLLQGMIKAYEVVELERQVRELETPVPSAGLPDP
jgi:hypothetical protein